MLIVEPGGCGAHVEGEFYDTISASGSCTVRFKTADIGQRMIMVRAYLGMRLDSISSYIILYHLTFVLHSFSIVTFCLTKTMAPLIS